MRFTKAIFAGVISALYIAGGVSALDDCDVGPYASHNFMGYPGKYPVYFCNSKWKSGAVVTGIEVWATAWQIKGIRLEYSDGSDHMAGTNGGDRHDVLRWDAADKITDMKLAVNYAGDALGLVHVEVGEKKLDVRSDTGPSNGDEWNIGSGYMLGHAGDNGAMVSNWIPLFLGQTTGKAEITNIKFNDNLDEVNKQQKGISGQTAEIYIVNEDPVNSTNAGQSWQFNGQQTVTSTNTLSTTKESVFSMSESIEIGAEIGIPKVADLSIKSTTSFGYQMSQSQTSSIETSTASTIGWTQGSDSSSLLQPGHAMHCNSTAVRGLYQGDYTATVRITVGGQPYELLRPGKFEGTSWVQGRQGCVTMLIKDVPSDAKVMQASDTMHQPKRRATLFRA